MITLEKQFVSGEGGFSSDILTYTQIARTETTAIYERSRGGQVRDYEVFNIKILPKGTQIFKQTTEDDQEKYPSTSQFGISAWSINNRERAMQKYEALNMVQTTGVKTPKILLIPVGEFTVTEYAEQNQINYINASLQVKLDVENNVIKFVREERRHAKGKMSKIYAKV